MRSFSTIKGNALVNKFRESSNQFNYSTTERVGDHNEATRISTSTISYCGIGDDRKFNGSFIHDSVSGQNRRRRIEANERIKVIGRFSLALFGLAMIMIVCIFSEEHHKKELLYSESDNSNTLSSSNYFDIPISVSYDYVELYGPPAMDYEWMKGRFIIEPYKEAVVNYTDSSYNDEKHTVEWTLYTASDDNTDNYRRRLQSATTNLKESDKESIFSHKNRKEGRNLASSDAEVFDQGTGSTFSITSTDPYTSYTLQIKVIENESGETVKWLTYEDLLVCKYVRREIRKLTEEDRQELFDAMYTLWSTPLEEGKELYGDNYVDILTLTTIHTEYAGDITCDHMHDGMGFLTHHAALGRMFEASMQLVNPKVSLPYWDYTIDTLRSKGSPDDTDFITGSGIFDESSLGDYDRETHIVNSGRWGNYELYSNANTYSSVYNSYNYLRAPWNANNVGYITRSYYSNGNPVLDLPSCADHHDILQVDDYSTFAQNIAYKPHGKVHVILGGVWDANTTTFANENGLTEDASLALTVEAAALQKNLWRSNVYQCPTDCSIDETCSCSCPSINAWDGEMSHEKKEFEAMNLLTKYSSVFTDNPNYLYDIDGNPIAYEIMKFLCNDYDYSKPKIAEMYEASAPLDPAFWITHPTVERIFSWRSIQGFDTMNWATNSSLTSSTGYCYGHEENDVLNYSNLVDGDSDIAYTNRDVLDLFDPNVALLPFVYDSFAWEHCILEGFSSDLMDTT